MHRRDAERARARSARRPPGCCPITTSPGTSPGTAGRTPRSASPPSARGSPPTWTLGTRRARAAALLSLSLPGAAYVYQGEELGLWEVEDIPYELRQDPMCRTLRPDRPGPGRLPGAAAVGRRRAAVRLQPGRRRGAPWLPQPADWKDRTVRGADRRPDSMLELYRAAIAHPAGRPGARRRRADAGCPPPTGCSRSAAAGDSAAWSTSPTLPVPLPPHGRAAAGQRAARRRPAAAGHRRLAAYRRASLTPVAPAARPDRRRHPHHRHPAPPATPPDQGGARRPRRHRPVRRAGGGEGEPQRQPDRPGPDLRHAAAGRITLPAASSRVAPVVSRPGRRADRRRR